MNTLAITDPKFAITPTGIQFHQDLSYEEWDDLGQKLAPIGKSIGFILGDWINYGSQKNYGEKYDEAIARTGIDYGYLRNMAYVARKVDLSCRRDNLAFEHHAVVAKLKPDEQSHWLDMTKQHKLTVRRLRKSINFGRLATEEEVQGDPADRGHVTYLALLNRIRRWWKRETGKAPVEEWDDDRREGLKKDFKLVLDIYEAL
jgi:hypothetical protein